MTVCTCAPTSVGTYWESGECHFKFSLARSMLGVRTLRRIKHLLHQQIMICSVHLQYSSNRRCVSRRVDVWLLPGFPICSTPYALVAKLQYCRLRSVAIAVLVLGGRTSDRSPEIASAVCAARDVMQEPTSGYFHGHTSSSTVTVHGSDDSAGSGTFECAQMTGVGVDVDVATSTSE